MNEYCIESLSLDQEITVTESGGSYQHSKVSSPGCQTKHVGIQNPFVLLVINICHVMFCMANQSYVLRRFVCFVL